MKKNKVQLTFVFTILMMLAALGMVFDFILEYSAGYFTSDCADTIMWAKASLDSGSIFNSDFSYAALLPFGGQLIMLPFVAIFGVTMKAQIIGMIVFFLLFTAAIFFLCVELGMNINMSNITTSILLFTLMLSEKLREIFFGHIIYYSLGVFFIAVGLILAIKYLKHQKNINIYLILLTVFSILCATDGMQVIVMYSVPIIIAFVVLIFFDYSKKLNDKEHIKKYIIISDVALSTIAGMIFGKIITNGIVCTYAEGYSKFSTMDTWIANAGNIFTEFIKLFGVTDVFDIIMFEAKGITIICRIIAALMVLFIPVIMTFLFKRFNNEYRLMIIVHHVMSLVIIMGWVFGRLNSARWRLSPIVVTSVILCGMFAGWIIMESKAKRNAAIIITMFIVIMLVSFSEFIKLDKQSDKNENLTEVIQMLKDNNLSYGYATFWNANAVTVLSDSEIQIRDIDIGHNEFYERKYQSNSKWYSDAPLRDNYFVLLTENEYNNDYLQNEQNFTKEDGMFMVGNYYVLVYNENIFN